MQHQGFLANKRILVVEDNSISQMLAKHTLSSSGASVDICDTGTRAIEILQREEYDIILMDLHMPELDGYQATDIIRNELGLDTPILAMTAVSIFYEQEKCIAAGMNGSVPKPFTVEALGRAIAEYVNITDTACL